MPDLRISDLIQRTPNGQEFFEVIIPPFTAGTNRKVLLSDLNQALGLVASVSGSGVDNTDPQNPILNLANGLAAVDTTGTAVTFAIPQIYGSIGTPETGNITLVSTGLVKGMTQLMIHNNGSEPTFGSEFTIIYGTYEISVDNFIMFCAVSTSLILVTISQEL